MSQHPLIADHLSRFGVAHTCLGRHLRGNRVGRRKTADNDPIKQSGEDGPIPYAEQEKRLADTKMWVPHRAFEPATIARAGASGYASKLHLPDPHEHSYSGIRTSTDNLREIGRAYDRLPTRDESAIPHFEAMRREIANQHDHMTNAMGIKTEVVDHDPYPTVHHMVQDVVNNKRIKVLSTKVTGGHDFLSDEDNDKFRAVHDVFGHAATGRGFDAHGEEAAWLAHSRMFTPHARGAMSSETRGQNSALHINGTFQAQKTALLPRHMWDDTAVSKHLSAKAPLSFEAFTTQAVMHLTRTKGDTQALCGADLSQPKPNERGFERNCPDCVERSEQDRPYSPRSDMASWTLKDALGTRKVAHDSGDGETIYHCPFCGSGQVLARSDRTIECEFCHTCFTVQVQPQYSAFPQTVNGQPVQVPGMPGQTGVDPSGAGGPVPPGGDPAQGGDPAGGFPPDADADGDPTQDEGGDDDDTNPFAKGGSLRTTAGKTLAVDDYLAHLALKHTTDRTTTLAAIRSRRG